MAIETGLLQKLIDQGVNIARNGENRSRLFSTFKRTVKGWESEFKKIKSDDENDKIKKLNKRMHTEAEKYLKEIKDYIKKEDKSGNTKITYVKNREVYENIKIYKKGLKEAKENFNNLLNNIGNAQKEAKNAYEEYKSLKKNFSDKDINNKVNNDNYNVTFKDNTNFLKFVEVYREIKKNKKVAPFTDWLWYEYYTLNTFKSITLSELISYQSHQPYIDNIKDNSAVEATKNITNLYNSIPDKLKRKINNNNFKALLKTAGAYFTASACIVVTFIFPFCALITLGSIAFGIKQIAKINKPLIKYIESSIDKASSKLNRLKINQNNSDKSKLAQEKVNYMHNVFDNTKDTDLIYYTRGSDQNAI